MSWPELKEAVAKVYGPIHDQKHVRLDLFSIKQHSTLEAYITEFSRLSLQVPELDELSRGLLFTSGLRPELKQEVLRDHPSLLDHAIRSAQAARHARIITSQHSSSSHQPLGKFRKSPDAGRSFAQVAATREHPEVICYNWKKPGHLAKQCQQHPNGGRQ